MVTKSCTKNLIFSTIFLCENLATEDFATLPMGKKFCIKILQKYAHSYFEECVCFVAGLRGKRRVRYTTADVVLLFCSSCEGAAAVH